MTSVLTYGGLNYQVGNPVRGEFTVIKREIVELRTLIDSQNAQIASLKAELSRVGGVDSSAVVATANANASAAASAAAEAKALALDAKNVSTEAKTLALEAKVAVANK
jgi:hypothetical protein